VEGGCGRPKPALACAATSLLSLPRAAASAARGGWYQGEKGGFVARVARFDPRLLRRARAEEVGHQIPFSATSRSSSAEKENIYALRTEFSV